MLSEHWKIIKKLAEKTNDDTLSNEEIIELTSILNKWKNVDEAFEWFIEDLIYRSKVEEIEKLYKENYSR